MVCEGIGDMVGAMLKGIGYLGGGCDGIGG